MGVAEAADAPVPQRPASAIAGVVMIATGVASSWVVNGLYASLGARVLHHPGVVLCVVVAVVMLLGTVKRAFRGFDRGTLLSLVIVVGLGRLTWSWVSGEGLTGHLHGAAVGALAIAAGAALPRPSDHDGGGRVQRLRRSAAMTGWTAVATASLGAVAPSATSAVFDIGVFWMPFFGAAFAGGAGVVAGLALGITALSRDPW